MKASKKSAAVAAVFSLAGIAGLMLAQAQETVTTGAVTKKPIPAETIAPALAAQLAAVETLPTIAADAVPRTAAATYYSAQCPYWPPLPGNIFGLQLWIMGDGSYLIDDLAVNYAAYDTTPTATTLSLSAKPMGGGFSPDDLTQGGYPYLTIALTGTNQLLITVINTNPATYYLLMTPVLASPNYPFAIIANGTAGQTNFTVNIGPFADEFFRALVATNNPGQGIAVFIDSPANGATVQ
jgi:hypothetical protein